MRFRLLLCLAGAATAADESWRPNLPDRDQFELGGFVYERNCAVCHGRFGDGKGEMAEGLGIKPQSFRSGIFKYRSTPPGKLPTNEDLMRTVRDGRSGTAMGMFSNLTDPELRAVVEYVKGFSRKWRDAKNYAPPVPLPQAPVWMSDPAARKDHTAVGRAVFLANCAACHGEKGDGKGPASAALKDEWGNAAQPADLRAPHFRSGDDPEAIFRTLTLGIGGTPMAPMAEALGEAQRWDVVAYVLSLRGTAD